MSTTLCQTNSRTSDIDSLLSQQSNNTLVTTNDRKYPFSSSFDDTNSTTSNFMHKINFNTICTNSDNNYQSSLPHINRVYSYEKTDEYKSAFNTGCTYGHEQGVSDEFQHLHGEF